MRAITVEPATRTAPLDQIENAVAEIRQVAPGRLRRVVVLRNMNFLKRFLENATDEDIERVAGAESDSGSIILEMSLPATMDLASHHDPLAAAKVRGGKMFENLLKAEGGYLSVTQVARQLGITPAGVHQRLRRNKLIAMDIGRKGFAYPAWQFDKHGGTLSGLPKVLELLFQNDCEALDIYTFFLNPTHALNEKSPLDELRKGNLDGVLRTARTYGEHGAL